VPQVCGTSAFPRPGILSSRFAGVWGSRSGRPCAIFRSNDSSTECRDAELLSGLCSACLVMSREELDTTPERSELMKRVRREGTDAELRVRRLLWETGARYRLNVSDLPGTPDIANKTRGKAIFVNGCFWHQHRDCPRGRVPRRNAEFWREKLERNKRRDARKRDLLAERGFDVLVVWECELDDPVQLGKKLRTFWFYGADEGKS
jgi:DNA mismatch endonuclease (patch repair protein)